MFENNGRKLKLLQITFVQFAIGDKIFVQKVFEASVRRLRAIANKRKPDEALCSKNYIKK